MFKLSPSKSISPTAARSVGKYHSLHNDINHDLLLIIAIINE